MASINAPTNISSLITWPKNRLQAHQTLRDLKANLQADAALYHAKKFLADSGEPSDAEKTRKIIQQLCDAIDRAKEKLLYESMRNIREEAQFSSMIDVGHNPNRPLSELVSIPEGRSVRSFKSDKPHVPYEIKYENHYVQSESDGNFDYIPRWFRWLVETMPYMLTVVWGLLILWGGAAIFHAMDEAAHEKPYYIIMLYTLQVTNTIGRTSNRSFIAVYRLG